jgi:glycosyltransferase involved in cell wall biosynthesis
MRVLQIGMSPLIGGVESFILNYHEKLKQYNIYYDYISMYDYIAYEDQIRKYGGIIHKIENPKKNPIMFFDQLVTIAKKYDVVHINMLSAANSLPIYACKKAGVKHIIVHSHNSKTERIDRYILHYINKAIINRLNVNKVACSDVAAKWMFLKSDYVNKEYTIIHNAIDLNKYSYKIEYRNEIRKEYNIDENTILMGNIGHLTLQKNPLFLIDVFFEVSKIIDNVRLMLVGDGDLTDKVKEKINEYKLEDKVIFTGIRYDAYKFYSAMDLFCMTSLYEGLSFTAVEAQASGIKCFFSSGISKETRIIPETEFLDIDSAKYWANRIASSNFERNIKAGEHIREKGFDIDSETLNLANYYLR